MISDVWQTDQLYIYDCTVPDDPILVPGEVKSIDYGQEGEVYAACYLPAGRGLYETPDVGATIELVLVRCGPPDNYENALPVVRISHAKARKWTEVPDLAEVGPAVLEMNVNWEGVVELLDAGKDDR